MPTITFKLTLQYNQGTCDFTITREDGALVFPDPANPGQFLDYWEQDNIIKTSTFPIPLPPGTYNINLNVVTNVNFDFSVSGVVVSLVPAPATINSTQVLNYTLIV